MKIFRSSLIVLIVLVFVFGTIFLFLGYLFIEAKPYIYHSTPIGVYYVVGSGQYIGVSWERVDGANPLFFRTLFKDEYGMDVYGNDRKHIYFRDKIISDDVKNFVVLPDSNFRYVYSRDNNSVYWFGEKILNADPETFIILSGALSKDKNRTYYEGKVVGGVYDANTLVYMGGPYYKDKDYVYYLFFDYYERSFSLRVIKIFTKNVDIKTFTVLGGYDNVYTKDKNGVYYRYYDGSIGIIGADPKTFSVFETKPPSHYAKDKNYVYFDGKIVKGADPETFITFNGSSGFDNKHSYSGLELNN